MLGLWTIRRELFEAGRGQIESTCERTGYVDEGGNIAECAHATSQKDEEDDMPSIE